MYAANLFSVQFRRTQHAHERPERSDLGREAHAGETDRPGETELMLHDLMLHVAGEIEAWGAGGGLPFTLPRDTPSWTVFLSSTVRSIRTMFLNVVFS